MSPSSPEGLYHPIPQAPVASGPILRNSIELEDEDIEGHDLHGSRHHILHEPVADSRIRWIYFTLGCAVLLPWNVMITATPYFLSRLAGSSLQSTFSSYMSTSFTAANFIFLAHATAVSKQSQHSRQIIITLLFLSVMNLSLALSTYFHVVPGLFFAFVILNGIAQAALGSYLQTSVIVFASHFGPGAVQSMLSGEAAVAVVVSGVQVVSATASVWTESTVITDGESETKAAFIFFGLSTIFLLVSVMAQRWMMNMPAYRNIVASFEKSQQPQDSFLSSASEESRRTVFRVAKANLPYEFAVAYVFMVTLAVFPPITASVRPKDPTTHPLLFSAVHFLVFGTGDFIGRYICSFPQVLIWSARKLLSLSLLRTLFIPLFLLCNVQRPRLEMPIPAVISSDLIFMIILLAFGISNGYVSSLCMMAASSLEHNPRLGGRREDVDIAATVATFCLVGGLALGSVASFAVSGTICQCNPFSH